MCKKKNDCENARAASAISEVALLSESSTHNAFNFLAANIGRDRRSVKRLFLLSAVEAVLLQS